VVPIAQSAWQLPLLQTWPAGQALPHAPQFKPSLEVLTQRPVQRVWPPSHMGAVTTSGIETTPVSIGGGLTPVSAITPESGRRASGMLSATAQPAERAIKQSEAKRWCIARSVLAFARFRT
jgi:hypothetical protein